MRVLLVTGSFPPDRCGVGDYTYNLAKALSSLPAMQVAVLTSVSSAPINPRDPIEVFRLIPKWRASAMTTVVRVIRRWSPHIVHVQYPTQGYADHLMPHFVPMASFLMGKKVIQTWHEGYSRRQAFRLLLKAIVPGGIIVIDSNYRAKLSVLLRWSLWGKRLERIDVASNIPKCALNEENARVLRHRYGGEQKRLVVFFGFVYPHKGIEQLFTIADPETDRILIAGEINRNDPYGQKILGYTKKAPWEGKSEVLGFLSHGDIAALLAIADAVILPFREGATERNASIHAACLQGTFVLTTSNAKKGYDEHQNVYYARPDDLDKMRMALNTYAGTRRVHALEAEEDPWHPIATKHRAFYEKIWAS